MITLHPVKPTVKSQQQLRAAGIATWKSKIDILKVDENGKSIVPRSAFLGIARKLINLEKRDHPVFTRVTRTKDHQSFDVELNGKSWMVSCNRPSYIWCMSEG